MSGISTTGMQLNGDGNGIGIGIEEAWRENGWNLQGFRGGFDSEAKFKAL